MKYIFKVQLKEFVDVSKGIKLGTGLEVRELEESTMTLDSIPAQLGR